MQQMRAAQKSDPDLFADCESTPAESTTTSAEGVRPPIESQVVERAEPETPPSAALDSLEPGPSLGTVSLDSSSSHPVHVNIGAFGAPAVVLHEDDADEGPESEPAPASGRISSVRPVAARPATASRRRLAVVAGIGAAAAASAAAAWWYLTG